MMLSVELTWACYDENVTFNMTGIYDMFDFDIYIFYIENENFFRRLTIFRRYNLKM